MARIHGILKQVDLIAFLEPSLLERHSGQAAVVSLSGGGPAAIEVALRHPARCQALVAISAVSHPNGAPTGLLGRLLATRLFTSNVAGWLIGAAVKRRPAFLAIETRGSWGVAGATPLARFQGTVLQ